MAETSSPDTPSNPQSSLDVPSIDAYVSSLIASGAVEEGQFYKWTTPSGEEYYGPNPRRPRIVTPRTQRTPVDPLPQVEESDESEVTKTVRQITHDVEDSTYGDSDSGIEAGRTLGVIDEFGNFTFNAGEGPATLASTLESAAQNLKVSGFIDNVTDIASKFDLDPDSFWASVANMAMPGRGIAKAIVATIEFSVSQTMEQALALAKTDPDAYQMAVDLTSDAGRGVMSNSYQATISEISNELGSFNLGKDAGLNTAEENAKIADLEAELEAAINASNIANRGMLGDNNW